jgi:alanyl-tRNA synthetase
MNFREVRQKFLDYFQSQGHEIVRSAPLIPWDDPTLLFTNAGMVQFKRLFLGEEVRGYTRAASSQKCVRAGGKHNDLENVGHTARHHTFFEMLGNFSFGDYFKEEAILWAWELLTEGYGLPQEKLYVSVYRDDDEAFDLWERKVGVPVDRIVRLGEKDNFWAMGDTGPCGPCSEILIDQGAGLSCGRPDCAPGCDCDRYLEIWNLVFTQFDRDSQGQLNPLPKPNIDTGMGLERIAAVVQGVTSNYDTDLFTDLIAEVESRSEKKYGVDLKQDISFRVIADHARATAFLVGDGIMPSNEGRGYVLRRIVRRAIRFGQVLGLDAPFFHQITNRAVDIMGPDYSELVTSRSFIHGIVLNEEKRFADTLFYGLKVLNDEIADLKARGEDTIPGALSFKLYDTYGLSVDIVEDVAREEGLRVDKAGYEEAMTVQRSQSQEAWKGSGEEEIPEAYRKLTARGLKTRFLGYENLTSTAEVLVVVKAGEERPSAEAGQELEIVLNQTPFYGEAGGQVGDSGWLTRNGMRFHVTDTLRFGNNLFAHQGKLERGEITVGDQVEAEVDEQRRQATALNHTATHLLHAALREVLGDHVKQAGSLVAPDRLRFDFSHFTQVGKGRLKEVEDLVNARIRANLPLATDVMSREEAMKTGAMAIFEERYGETVRLVQIGNGVSMELCGGTHTARTGDVGLFTIVGESAVGANLRRIEALTGKAALEHLQDLDAEMSSIALLLKAAPDKVWDRVARLLQEQKEREREIESLKARLFATQSEDVLSGLKTIGDIEVLVQEVAAESPRDLREMLDRIKDRLKSGVVVLGSKQADKAMLICAVTKDLLDRVKAGDIIKELSGMVGGKGGGRADMAQGGGSKPENLKKALDSVYDTMAKKA